MHFFQSTVFIKNDNKKKNMCCKVISDYTSQVSLYLYFPSSVSLQQRLSHNIGRSRTHSFRVNSNTNLIIYHHTDCFIGKLKQDFEFTSHFSVFRAFQKQMCVVGSWCSFTYGAIYTGSIFWYTPLWLFDGKCAMHNLDQTNKP